MKQKVFRFFLLVPGLLNKLIALAKDGARDLSNKQRFKNAIIDNGSSFNENTVLHNHSRVLSNCVFNNVTLGSYSYVGSNSLLQNVTIGKFCSIANNVMIGLGKHPMNELSTSPIFYRKNNTFNLDLIKDDLEFEEYDEISIGNDVWIGAGVIIMDGITIADGSVIAAGAVVTKDVNAYDIVGGIPAKFLKKRIIKKNDNNLPENWWSLDLTKIISSYE